ncbi:unnamed protein product [Blepharisma stoltei]|uniref:Uncharacterized protein n=1 Tax=Blepharisma stoltei TaxID=1481888 RepID=A0AAU9J2G4_9CILI|nr:unnamed protein product [Blepharisma stoltei]
MGCGQIKNGPPFTSTLFELQPKVILQQSTPDNASEPFNCQNVYHIEDLNNSILKEKIREVRVKHIHYNSLDLNNEISLIKGKYIGLVSVKDAFFSQCHAQCIKDFQITDGIFIMLLSIYASNPSIIAKLKASQSPPYISINKESLRTESRNIVDAWDNFANKMKELKETYAGIPIVRKRMQQARLTLENYLVEIDRSDPPRGELVALQINQNLAEEGISIINKLETESDKLHEDIKDYVKSKLDKEEVINLGKEAIALEAYDGNKILHSVIAPKLNK